MARLLAWMAAGAALVVAAIVAFGVATQDAPAVAERLRADDPETVALGERLYAENCASCHGDGLEGQPNWRQRLPNGRLPAPPHDRSGHTWHHPDRVLIDLTKRGPAAVIDDPTYVSDMPAYGELLSDAEIVAVLSFIKSTWPDDIARRHDALNESDRKQ